MRRAWLGFGSAVAAAAVTVWGCSSSPPPPAPKTVGATLDDIRVFDLTTGRPLSAWSSLQGSEGVFFTCLCPPCESVALALASKSGRVAQVLVLLVASEEKAMRLRDRLDEGVRVLADPEFRVGKSLNACFLPRAYLVDKDGRLVWKQDDYKTTLRDAWKRASADLSKEVRK